MADVKQEFDLESYAASKGLQIDGMDQNGLVSLSDPAKKLPPQQFDTSAFLKSKNLDPNNVNIKLNSPSTAKPENALGFGDQLGMNWAHTPEQQKGYLQRTFGANNVVQDEDGKFKVKDSSGLWKKADTSWYNDIIQNTPSLIVGAQGSARGATFGLGVGGPWGALVGGALGGALAIGLEQYGQNKLSEMAGIRTEEDLNTMKDELGRDFMGNMVFGLGVPLVAKGLKAAAPAVKEALANMGEKLISGTSARDWMVALKNSDNLNIVRKVATLDAKAASKSLAESGGVLPSADMAAEVLTSHIESAKNMAESQFSRSMKLLESAKAVEVHPEALPSVYNNLVSKLSSPEIGLLKQDKAGQWVFKNFDEIKNSAVGVVDEKAQDRLKQLFNVIKNKMTDSELTQVLKGDATQAIDAAYNPKVQMTVDEMLQLKKFSQNISKDLGHFSNSSSISDNVKRIMAETNNAFDKAIVPTTKQININGQSAAEILNSANAKYSQYRNAYDVFSDKIKDFSNTNDVRKVVSKMTTEDGAQYLSAFKDLADATGKTGMHEGLNQLELITAGRNLASKKVSQLGVMLGAGIGGSVGGLGGAAVGGIAASQMNANNISAAANIGTKAVLGSANIAERVGQYTGLAKGINFLRNMQPDAKLQMLQDQNIMGQFLNSIVQYQPMKDSANQQLMQQVPGAGNAR